MNSDGVAPRHGHRTPAELAEDEIIAAMRGDGCGVPLVDGVPPDRMRHIFTCTSRLLPVGNADRVHINDRHARESRTAERR
jgi:hypothetical protein